MNIAFISCVFATPGHDEELPSFVYRVDKRHPSEIFKKGFNAWGVSRQDGEGNSEEPNNNIADHVSGRSCTSGATQRNSIFISTTSSKTYAENLVSNIVKKLKNSEFIVMYTIHPDRNTYQSYRSLMWLADYTTISVSPNVFAMSLTQSEWVAVETIPNIAIESATVYFREGNTIRIEEHRNPNYINSIDRVANFRPYTLNNNQAQTVTRQEGGWRVWLRNNIHPFVTQCFAPSTPNVTDVRLVSMPTTSESIFSPLATKGRPQGSINISKVDLIDNASVNEYSANLFVLGLL